MVIFGYKVVDLENQMLLTSPCDERICSESWNLLIWSRFRIKVSI